MRTRHHPTRYQGDADRRLAQDRRPRPLSDLDRHPLLRSHAGAVHQAWRLRSEARREGRPGRGPASHRRRRGHRAGPVVREGAGRPRGINRAGYFVLPMDETLAWWRSTWAGGPRWSTATWCACAWWAICKPNWWKISSAAFVNHAGANLHARVLYGRSSHHKIEAIFKCFARALKYACSTDRRLRGQLPSTKGLL
jgi:hypothetical protein